VPNLFQFLDDYGNISMQTFPFCDIDALVLSHISFLPLEGIVSKRLSFNQTVGKAAAKANDAKDPGLSASDRLLALYLAKCSRYSTLPIGAYANVFDEEREEQFCAVTVILPDGTAAATYRGTDATLTGWKEDFNMSFMSPVPAQISSVKYLSAIADKTQGPLYTIGHSKGGNLAIYSACFSGGIVQGRIIKAYNLDGPGFLSSVIESFEYQQMLPKLVTYIPQTSVVGLLLEHEEEYVVVKSIAEGILQHDLYSWQVENDKLVTLPDNDEESKYIDATVKGWVQSMSEEEREAFVELLFKVLDEAGIDNTNELVAKWPEKLPKILEAVGKQEPKMQKFLLEVILLLFKSSADYIPFLIHDQPLWD